MPRHMKGFRLQRTDSKAVAVRENAVELTTVATKAFALIKNSTESGLYRRDMSANPYIATQLCLM